MAMRPDLSASVLRSVTQTFRKIGFAARPEPTRRSDYLVIMNAPALMGMRDAACLETIAALRQPLFSLSEAERLRLYQGINTCLEEAAAAHARVIPEPGMPDAAAAAEFLNQLQAALQAVTLLVAQGQQLFSREKILSQWLGGDYSLYLRHAEETINNLEIELYHMLQELTELAETPLAKFRDAARAALSRPEAERYDKALAEYRTHYRAVLQLTARESGPDAL